MNKPENWEFLPGRLLDTLLWDIDSLDYDSYDSSKSECIDNISNGIISDTNRKIIDAYWKALSLQGFECFVRAEMTAAESLIVNLRALLD